MLVRPDNHQTALGPIDRSLLEDIFAIGRARAEGLLIIEQTKATFGWKEDAWERLDRQLSMVLLKYRSNVDHGVNIVALWCKGLDRRRLIRSQEVEQGSRPRRRAGIIASADEDKQTPSAVGFHRVSQLHRLGIAEPYDRC